MGTTQTDDDKRQMALEVLLTEYKELKSETGGRVQRQSQAFNYFLVSIGVLVSALATIASKTEFLDRLFSAGGDEPDGVVRMLGLIIAGLPLITTPLSLIFFDDELMIWAAEIYILTRIKRHVNRLLHLPLPPPEHMHLLDGTFAWRSLHLKSILHVNHARYASGRWVLFWVPIATAFAALLVIIYKNHSNTGYVALPIVLLVINGLLSVLLFHATRATVAVRKRYCELVKTDALTENDKLLFPEACRRPFINWHKASGSVARFRDTLRNG